MSNFANSHQTGYISIFHHSKVLLENGWNSKQMITEGEAAIPLETTLRLPFTRENKTEINYSRIHAIHIRKVCVILEMILLQSKIMSTWNFSLTLSLTNLKEC